MDTLMRVHGHELLVDGCFNADPHAGNFLLLPDDRIGLIDYGATKTLTREERLITCIMYAALARKDSQMILDVSVASGYKSKHMDKDVIMKLVRLGFDTFGRDLLGDKNTQQFIDELYAKDPYVVSRPLKITRNNNIAAARTTDTKKWLIIL
jgi:aarF domain-containing kinase